MTVPGTSAGRERARAETDSEISATATTSDSIDICVRSFLLNYLFFDISSTMLFENKENDNVFESWSAIEREFYEALDFWFFDFRKETISVEKILAIQEAFSQCFDILQISDEDERDYVTFIQNIESIRIVLTAASSEVFPSRQPFKDLSSVFSNM